MAEFVPFGANQIVQLNQNLGSTERVQGGFFTALIDENSAGTVQNNASCAAATVHLLLTFPRHPYQAPSLKWTLA